MAGPRSVSRAGVLQLAPSGTSGLPCAAFLVKQVTRLACMLQANEIQPSRPPRGYTFVLLREGSYALAGVTFELITTARRVCCFSGPQPGDFTIQMRWVRQGQLHPSHKVAGGQGDSPKGTWGPGQV